MQSRLMFVLGLVTGVALLMAGLLAQQPVIAQDGIGIVSEDGLNVQLPESQAGALVNRSLADLILIARRDYDRDLSRTATLWFRDGSFQVLGNLSEIGADFVCTLTVSAPPVATSENTPPLETEKCVPISEVVAVTFDRRIGR